MFRNRSPVAYRIPEVGLGAVGNGSELLLMKEVCRKCEKSLEGKFFYELQDTYLGGDKIRLCAKCGKKFIKWLNKKTWNT